MSRQYAMNELHAARAILQKAMQQVRQQGGKRIVGLYLVMGEYSTYTEQAMRLRWAEVSKGTPAEGAELYFRRAPGEVQCMACFTKYHPEAGQLICPNCGGVGAKILTGEEFFLESVELE